MAYLIVWRWELRQHNRSLKTFCWTTTQNMSVFDEHIGYFCIRSVVCKSGRRNWVRYSSSKVDQTKRNTFGIYYDIQDNGWKGEIKGWTKTRTRLVFGRQHDNGGRSLRAGSLEGSETLKGTGQLHFGLVSWHWRGFVAFAITNLTNTHRK